MNETRSTKPQLICGTDEAGRGPLAGPVTAAAVILPEDFNTNILGDSKKLTANARELCEQEIRSSCMAYGIGWVWHHEIDKINILQASLLAMQRAVAELLPPEQSRRDPFAKDWPRETGTIYKNPVDSFVIPELVLVDGNRCPEFGPGIESRAEIKGDSRFHCIMAASILAKTARDRWMAAADKLWPGYGFTGHKGYPTAAHKEAIYRLGPSPIHRLSFRGVRAPS